MFLPQTLVADLQQTCRRLAADFHMQISFAADLPHTLLESAADLLHTLFHEYSSPIGKKIIQAALPHTCRRLVADLPQTLNHEYSEIYVRESMRQVCGRSAASLPQVDKSVSYTIVFYFPAIFPTAKLNSNGIACKSYRAIQLYKILHAAVGKILLHLP